MTAEDVPLLTSAAVLLAASGVLHALERLVRRRGTRGRRRSVSVGHILRDECSEVSRSGRAGSAGVRDPPPRPAWPPPGAPVDRLHSRLKALPPIRRSAASAAAARAAALEGAVRGEREQLLEQAAEAACHGEHAGPVLGRFGVRLVDGEAAEAEEPPLSLAPA